jgi:tetratricopeptide (TPR) repeat protein
MPSEEFIASLAANLDYWRQQTTRLDDTTIAHLDGERENLFRAVQLGLRVHETGPATAELVSQCFPLIERHGYWQEWLTIVQRASQECVPEVSALRCRLLYQLGHLYRLLRRLDEAVDTHRQSAQVAEQLPDDRLLAQAWFGLCVYFWHSRQYEAAEEYGLKALEMFERVSADPKWKAASLNTLGLAARDFGSLSIARQRLSEAVALWREVDDATELARALNNLATVWQAAKDAEAALACYQEAAALLESTSSQLDKAMVQISLGSLYFQMERLAEAEAIFRQANSTYLRRSGHLFYRALVSHNLGNVLLEKGQLVEAEAYLQVAATLWPEVQDTVFQANTLGSLAELRTAQGENESAVACYDDAIALLRQQPDTAWAQQLLATFKAARRALSG